MRSPFVALLLAIAAAPLFAMDRGTVLLDVRTHVPETPKISFDFWQYRDGWPYAIQSGGEALIFKHVPLTGTGHLLVPAPDQFVFEDDGTVSTWDGVEHRFTEPGLGYTEIFHDEAFLGEIAPMRSGNFLIAESWNERAHGAKLIEFNLHGIVAEYPFPEVVDVANNSVLGAEHIELLADQCTVLYTTGEDDPAGNRVRRLNICTRQPQPDFAALPAGRYAGAIRQLPNGDVLVANGAAVLRFSPQGSLLRTYPLEGVTHIALTADGAAFWAAGVELDVAKLVRLDLDGSATAARLGNPASESLYAPLEINDLVVVGEWRAGSPALNRRVRAVRPH